MKTKLLYGVAFVTLISVSALTGCGRSNGADKYDKDGRLILELKNTYFGGIDDKVISWDGTDTYTEMINEKFNVKIKPSNYSYGTWDDEVNMSITGQNLPDTIHYNLKAYNFGSSYEQWVKKMVIKALPTDLSKWPNLKSMIDNITNVDALKIDGKLYGIPIANDISNPQKDFSNFTYVYRRDWAKAIDKQNEGKAGYTPIYKEGDVYTWDEFQRLLQAFKVYVDSNDINEDAVIVDQPWAFPSLTNFYKSAPHCFTKDSSGKAINNFTSPEYIEGLQASKDAFDKHYYPQDQYLYTEENDKAYSKYKAGLAGILYDNFSLSNYGKLRKSFKAMNKTVPIDDGVAFLKVKNPNDKFALEGTENWFSMTMFNYDISDMKMHKILDIIDYLLSEEGTRLAIYGKEGYDYNIIDGQVVLTEQGWEKGADGQYGTKINGAKCLRYMATLGNDTKAYDPYTDMDAFNIVNAWQEEMKVAKNAGNLRVVQEPGDISWMSTPTKNDKTESLLMDANSYASQYCVGKPLTTIEAYKAAFDKDSNWKKALDEINAKLGK